MKKEAFLTWLEVKYPEDKVWSDTIHMLSMESNREHTNIALDFLQSMVSATDFEMVDGSISAGGERAEAREGQTPRYNRSVTREEMS